MITAGSGLSAAAAKSYILAGLLSCAPAAPPAVTMTLDNKPPEVSHILDQQQLAKFNVDTQFSHGPKEVFITGGLTESRISSKYEVRFERVTNTLTNKSCISLLQIDVQVIYAPKVYIASNHAAGSCHYNQIWLHELKHVNTDIITLNEFLPQMRQHVANVAAFIGVQGPLTAEEWAARQQDIAGKLSDAIRQATTAMDKTRMQRQQLIDTRQEYLRLSNLCLAKP